MHVGIAGQHAARADAAPRQAKPRCVLSLVESAAVLMAIAPRPRRTGRSIESARVAARRGLEDAAIVALSFCAGLRSPRRLSSDRPGGRHPRTALDPA